MKTDHYIFTDKGGRPLNEDRADWAGSGDRYCFILCDGLGGHGMGDRAAELVTAYIKERFLAGEGLEAFAAGALPGAQAALRSAQAADPRLKGMRTTAVILCIEGDRGLALHIGDSRLYRFRGGKIVSRTRDHSIPQVLCMSGEIEESEIRSHPDRNKLLRALGDDSEELRCESSSFDVAEGDAFLLCSDGFWEPVTEIEMERTLAEEPKAKKWLAAMVKLAVKNSAGKPMDNFTAIAVKVKR